MALFARQIVRTFRLAQGVYTRSDFVRKVTSALILQALVLVLAFANSALVTRWLGPEQKGILTLALLIPNMLALFLSCGIAIANVYFAGSRRLSVAQLTSNSVAISLVATFVGAIGIGIAARTGTLDMLFPGVAGGMVLLAMLILPVSMASGSFAALVQGLQRTTQVSLVNVAQAVAGLCFTLVLVIGLHLGVPGALLASLGAALVGLILFGVMLHRIGGTFRPRWDTTILRSTLGFGLRGHIGNVLQFFNYRLDVLIVNYFLGPVNVGIYSVAVLLAELLWQLPNSIGFVIFPKASASTPEAMNAFTPRVFRLTLAITAAAAVVLGAIGKPFIELVYTSDFSPAYSALLVLLPGVVLLGGGKVLTNELAGRGYAHYNSINSGLALVATLVLDVLLIPRYGITGAALASSIAYALNLMTALVFYRLVSRKHHQLAPQ
jgi:O-antigen/teichoic acid export membrane protein